jgi:hypothetical protein
MPRVARAVAAALALGFLALGGSLAAGRGAGAESTQAAAQALDKKLQVLRADELRPAKSSYPAIVITDYEANSYLQIHGREFLPAGVANPAVHFQPEHVTGLADVNFEDFSKIYTNPNDWGPRVLAAMFHGKQRVTAAGKFQSGNGLAKVQIESVTVGTMTVPNWLVDFVLQNYLQPRYKFDLSKPLPLPDHVTQIVLGLGRATFLRSPNKTH